MTRRPHGYEGRDRRNLLVNLGFAIVVVVSVVILIAAGAYTWYDSHLAAAAHVNGQAISKDELNARLAVESFRLRYEQQRLDDRHRAGTIRSSDYDSATAAIQSQQQSLPTVALEGLIDGRVQAALAPKEGVQVTDADVDAQMTQEATQPEQRRTWVIEVQPKKDPGAPAPTDAQTAAAKAAADQALADLKSGKDWVAVSKAVSTAADKDTGGDQGYIDAKATLDPGLVTAVFKAQKDTPTDVIAGADGTYRIARVTDIVPQAVDPDYRQRATDGGVDLVALREALRTDVVKQRLSDKIVAQAIAPGPQRQVGELFIEAATDENNPKAVRVRHILYSPKGDPSGAAQVAPTDPSWKEAEDKAKAAVTKLRADPTQFASLAESESNDTGSGAKGGALGYVAETTQFVDEFKKAVLAPGLKPGQILDPVKSQFGWHVIQILNPGPTSAWAASLKQQADGGADFRKLAELNSDAADTSKGGDLGWVARGQLEQALDKAVFATPVGKTSDPVVVSDADTAATTAGVAPGTYLFKVYDEQNRAPEGEQLQKLKDSAFTTWYNQQKAQAQITRDIPTSADQTTT
ncbi:MAG: peptidylprolyl isomerase [Chloroflexota bacterium]